LTAAPVAPPSGAGAAVKPYPLKTCIVSGEELGKMGEPYKLVYEGQEIKFCCKGCEPDFKKDPAKYLAKLQEAPKK
jgi:YHS domain-containing protein